MSVQLDIEPLAWSSPALVRAGPLGEEDWPGRQVRIADRERVERAGLLPAAEAVMSPIGIMSFVMTQKTVCEIKARTETVTEP